MNRRDEILQAVAEAARTLDEFPTGDRTSFDIIGAVTGLNIPLLFRPLKHLLGAIIASNGGVRGIIVTTQRDLHVQRFTLAHELGHFLLGHALSLDQEIEFAGRNASESRPTKEVAADTFASELLGSKKLILKSAKRHHWTKKALHQPDNIYQLSLRLGISYQAACWALVTSKILNRKEAKKLLDLPVKDRKHAFAPADLITSSWANVWALSKADTGTFLEAGPKDLFAIHVQDHASAGYLWQLVDTETNAEIVGEGPAVPNQAYGEKSSRVVYLRFGSPGVHRLAFEHIRPWSGAALDHIKIEIDDYGKEHSGFARRTKLGALARAA